MLKYYDRQNDRLVFFEKKASADFWDKHWEGVNFKSEVKIYKNNPFILKNTKKFLEKGKILEGGCGIGGNVYCLASHGYSAFGVDFAKKTVKKINKYFPKLKATIGDVRNLKFKDDFFDGYWSLGVIEHFYKGYEDILKEMRRVVRKDGYVFLTFPYMSFLRKFKAKIGLYKKYESKNCDLKNFYQFVLDKARIENDFKKYGFILKYNEFFDGLKGFKDEVLVFKPFLQKLYDYNGSNFLVCKLKSLLDDFLKKFSAHMLLIVFQKKQEKEKIKK